jgi:Carboxypeptidase regulatory-like domain/TonB dependent receptor
MKSRSIPFLLGIVCSVGVHAQAVVGFGAVTGTVLDYTGSGIPDTTVVISNANMGTRREMDTTDDGIFNASAMIAAPGYSLKVSRKGFSDVEYKDFEIPVGHTLNFKVTMAQEAALQRQGEAQHPSIELEDAHFALQGTFYSADVDAMPTRNRDVNTLAQFAPAVTPDHGSGKLGFQSEPGTSTVLMDGVLTNNLYFYDRPPIAPPVTQEAVEEVQVVSAGGQVEFSHTMGGAVNIATHTPGSAIHAEAYDYYNTHSLNAADRYAPGFKPPGWQHQFGANAGGPVGWGRLFWFANAEDLDGHSEELNRVTNQLLVNPLGTAILPSNCTATAAQCTSAIAFLNAQLNREVTSSLASLSGLFRVDWRLNDFNNLSFEADAMHRHSPNGTDTEMVSPNAGLLGPNGTYTDEARFARVGYTGIWSGNAVNEVHGGLVRDRFSDYADPQLLPSTGALGIDLAGTPFGGSPNLPIALSEQRYQIVDNLTVTLGSQLFKFGMDFSTNEDWNDQVFNRAGSYFYPTLTSFADDFSANSAGHKDYTNFTQGFGLPVVDLHSKRLGVYAQDTWRPTPNLTIDFGLRWEKTFIPQPVVANPIYFQTGSVGSPSLDVPLRLGLAYRLDSHTVIRLGVGDFYQPFPGQLLESLFTGNGIYQLPVTITPNQTNAPIFAQKINSVAAIPANTADITYAVSKFRNPISAQGVVTIERSVGKDFTVSLNYLYNRGILLWTATDENINIPTVGGTVAPVTKTYTIDNAAGVAVNNYVDNIYYSKVNTQFAHVYQVGNGGASAYNGATLQLRKRMSRDLSLEGSYTWSHAIDDVSGTPVVAGFIPISSVPGYPSADRGNSSFNQPNRGIIRWTWQPRPADNDSLAARYLINGWTFSGGATFASGLEKTPVVAISGQQFTGVSMVYLDSMNGSGGWSRVPFEPVNSLPTGPQYDVDARLTRNIPVTERVRAKLMLEAFNLLNTQYNTSVNTIAYLATAGVLRPVPGVGVGNGANGFPWGDNARRLQVALRIVF